MGSPIGPASYCEAFVMRRVGKIQEILNSLSDLKDSQMEATLLRSCLAVLKVSFALRICPPCYLMEAMAAFDCSMCEGLVDVAGGPLPDWFYSRASLPCSFGGL